MNDVHFAAKGASRCFEDNACYKYFAPDGAMMGSWLSRGPGVYAAAVFDGSLDWLNMRSMTTAQDLAITIGYLVLSLGAVPFVKSCKFTSLTRLSLLLTSRAARHNARHISQ